MKKETLTAILAIDIINMVLVVVVILYCLYFVRYYLGVLGTHRPSHIVSAVSMLVFFGADLTILSINVHAVRQPGVEDKSVDELFN